MATRPKCRKRKSATIVSSEEPSSFVQPDPSISLQTSMMEDIVSFCLAAINPALKETVQQCKNDFFDRPNHDTTSVADPRISLPQYLLIQHKVIRVVYRDLPVFPFTLEVYDKFRKGILEG